MLHSLSPYQNALRRMNDAKDILQKARDDEGSYENIEYVQIASEMAYEGVLIAVNEYLRKKEGKGFVPPQDFNDYLDYTGKYHKRLSGWLSTAHAMLYIVGYYYGTPSVASIQQGMEDAEKIIKLIKTNEKIMVQILTPYEDAMRYMENAKDLLKKADKMDGQYRDIKYVKMASGTAYSATLLVLGEYLSKKEGAKFKKPKSIDDYRIRIAKQNKRVIRWLNIVYDDLHLSGYYHGTPSYDTVKRGFDTAHKIIELVK